MPYYTSKTNRDQTSSAYDRYLNIQSIIIEKTKFCLENNFNENSTIHTVRITIVVVVKLS